MREVQENERASLHQLQADHVACLSYLSLGLPAICGAFGARTLLDVLLQNLNVESQKFTHHVVLKNLVFVLTLINHKRLLSNLDSAF